jgi:NTP pyrophosphatase (non-canonical NTP hydrolase)
MKPRWDKEYQRQVIAGLAIDHGVDELSHCALGLTGESGEVADLIKKSQYKGGSLDRAELKLELGDALWYLTAIAEINGWSLAEIAITNAAKLEVRRGGEYNAMDVCNLL